MHNNYFFFDKPTSCTVTECHTIHYILFCARNLFYFFFSNNIVYLFVAYFWTNQLDQHAIVIKLQFSCFTEWKHSSFRWKCCLLPERYGNLFLLFQPMSTAKIALPSVVMLSFEPLIDPHLKETEFLSELCHFNNIQQQMENFSTILSSEWTIFQTFYQIISKIFVF